MTNENQIQSILKDTKTEELKKCPFCANEINRDAIKCQYCGEFLDKEKTIIESENLDKLDENEKIFFDESKITKSNEKDLNPTEKSYKKAISRINVAFGWGCYSIIASIIAYIITLQGGDIGVDIDISIIEILYGGILVFFIYKRNRMATLFFFIRFLLSTFLMITDSLTSTAIGIRVLELYFLFMGIIGSFTYHFLTNQKRLSTSEIVILILGILDTILSIIGMFIMQ